MRELIHNGIRLEYQVEGEGIPLVFLHGMGGGIHQIRSTYEPLPGVSLIAMNQQGHGGSGADWDTLDFDRLGDDVIALLDELELEKACFAGISMGAAVSLNAAVRYPERVEKLLLIRNAWTDQPMSRDVQTAYRDLGLCLKEGGLAAFRKTEGFRIVSEPSAYTRNAFTGPFQDPSCLKNWQKYLILPGKTPISSLQALDRLTMPVSILANRNDLCHPYAYGEYLRDHIPGAEFTEIPDKDRDGAGHKAAVNLAVRRMLGVSCPR